MNFRTGALVQLPAKGDLGVKRLFVYIAVSLALVSSPSRALAGNNGTMDKSLLDRYYQGVTYFKHGDLERALECFKATALSAPADPLDHLSLAAALQEHGDTDDAIAEYERAIELRRGDTFAR